MSRIDWRSPGAYDDVRSLGAPGFAWEFLRRNTDFLKHREQLEQARRRGELDPAEVDAFSRRWDVRFCRCRRDGRRRFGSLGAPSPARDPCCDGPAG